MIEPVEGAGVFVAERGGVFAEEVGEPVLHIHVQVFASIFAAQFRFEAAVVRIHTFRVGVQFCDVGGGDALAYDVCRAFENAFCDEARDDGGVAFDGALD